MVMLVFKSFVIFEIIVIVLFLLDFITGNNVYFNLLYAKRLILPKVGAIYLNSKKQKLIEVRSRYAGGNVWYSNIPYSDWRDKDGLNRMSWAEFNKYYKKKMNKEEVEEFLAAEEGLQALCRV